MKSLNTYITEGLADWGDDKSFGKKISKQTTKDAIKQEIIEWIESNTQDRIYKNKIKFDFSTSPITINYDGDIKYASSITSLTNGLFQWGEVRGYFYCAFSNITSLEGAPKGVSGNFSCDNCKLLTSLEGSPEKVGGCFNCSYCDSLKSLKGASKEVWFFECRFCNSLASLEGAPEKVKDTFSCSHCQSLKSLKGGPEKVGGNFHCTRCPNLTSLEYAPKEVAGEFYCCNCGKKFTIDDVKKVSNVSGEISC